MQRYQLKLFGRLQEDQSRVAMGEFPLEAPDNFAAIAQAETALLEALPGVDHAVLHQVGVGVIWEGYARPPTGVSA
jgi:hypothetical protein